MTHTILIVEDDQRTQVLFRTIVERAGYNCLTASTMQQALNSLHDTIPDVIMLDLGLRGASGFDLVKSIQEDPRLANVKILVVSALTDLEHVARKYGLDSFVAKPVSSTGLLEALARVIDT